MNNMCDEFLADVAHRLNITGRPLTEYEKGLAKIVWDVAEVATLARASQFALNLHNGGYDASDVASELKLMAGIK